jgi:hypothetical protein
MLKRMIWIGLLLALAACSGLATGPTGDTASDPAAAGQFVPSIAGYTRSDASNLTEAISGVGGGAALISGNAALAAILERIDGMVSCYQDAGAVAAEVYTQADLGTVLAGEMPRAGVVAVINQDRVARNFLNCALGQQAQTFSAQAVDPCAGSGSFEAEGETISYVYAGTTPDFCNVVQTHFQSFGG